MLADPVDRLIVDVAREALAGRSFGRCVVVGDRSGELARTCRDEPGASGVTLACDSLLDERDALAAVPGLAVADPGDSGTFAGADLVLLRLPRAVDALQALAERVARTADPDVVVVGGARVRHMTTTMNGALGRGFAEVTASLGRAKSRALLARGPRADATSTFPRERFDDRLGFAIHADAGVFAGTRLDRGTELLARTLPRLAGDLPSAPARVADLGCGTGVLATLLARQFAGATVEAVDVSSAAVRSARATAAAAGMGGRVRVRRDAALSQAGLDLVVSNPPFHREAAKDSGLAADLIAAAGAALRPGGQLWLVWNSHLPYRPLLRELVGPTTVVTRDPSYTVTRSVRS